MRKKNQPWSAGIWRMIAISSLAASVFMAGFITYFFFAFKSNLAAFSDVPLCWAGAQKFNGIAAAQAIGRLDFVSFMLAAGGLLFALFAFFGFWTVRIEVIERANDAAAEVARAVANEYYKNGGNAKADDNSYGLAQIDVMDNDKAATGRDGFRFDPATVSVKGATEEKGASDDEV